MAWIDVGLVTEHNGGACKQKSICRQHLMHKAGLATHHDWFRGKGDMPLEQDQSSGLLSDPFHI